MRLISAVPPSWADLEAAAERDIHVVGDPLLGQTDPGGAFAVDVDVELGSVGDLLAMDVDRAGNEAKLADNVLSDGTVLVAGSAANLHVDLGGGAEVEDLGDHVGRLEVEDRAGEAVAQRGA